MANLETEQKASLSPPDSGANPPASVALHEENLEALLNALTGPARLALPEPPRVAAIAAAAVPAVSLPAEVLPPAVPDPASAALPAEVEEFAAEPQPEEVPERAAEPLAAENPTPESLQTTEAVPGEQPRQEETHEIAEGLLEAPVPTVAPVVDSQPAVVSKLALLSSIKQRRASAMRPEPATTASPEPDFASPAVVLPEMEAVQPDAEVSQRSERPSRREQPIEDQQPARETQSKDVARKNAAQEKFRGPEKTALAKEIPRKATDLGSLAERPAAKPAASSTRAAGTLLPPADDDPADKFKSLATSGAGMAVIGGALVAIGLTVYLLVGHGTKPAPGSPKPAVTATVQTPGVSTPPPDNSSAASVTAGKPLAGAAPSGTSRPEDPKTGKAPAKVEPVQIAKPAGTPTPANPAPAATPPPAAPPPVDVNAARTVARTFAPPATGARSADSTILEAPPALSATTPAAPAGVTLPTRIAALPPPPQPSAPKASAPPQISVASRVQTTKLVRQVTPAYPALAKATRVQGLVRFRATIATDGQIKGLVLLGGPPPLVQGATAAVKQWRYQPTLVNGEPVEVVTEIEVAFTL